MLPVAIGAPSATVPTHDSTAVSASAQLKSARTVEPFVIGAPATGEAMSIVGLPRSCSNDVSWVCGLWSPVNVLARFSRSSLRSQMSRPRRISASYSFPLCQ